jgi:hypothetical protein
MTRSQRFLLLVLASTLWWSSPRAARAEEPAVAAPARALWVRLDLVNAGLEAEAVRQAIEVELGVPVRLVQDGESGVDPALTVRTGARRRALAVAVSASGERLERAIDLPGDRTQAVESIAWLAGNLARDQAAELIAALRVEPEPPAPTPDPGASDEAERSARPPAPVPAPERKAVPERAGSERPPDAGAAKDDRRFPFDRRRPVNLTLVHPLTLLAGADQRTVLLELGLVYSLVGAIEGAGINPGWLRTRGTVKGVAASLVFTQTGPVEGVSASVGATSLERVRGAELAVGAALASGDIQGAQAAVGASVAGGAIRGVQLAVGASVAGRSVEGMQAALGANLSGESLRGVQVSAGLNVARDVAGAQLGVVNVGKNVRGLQLGVINVADELDGLSIGLINVARSTRLQALAWANSEGDANLALKIVSPYVYSQLGSGYRFDGDAGSVEVGLGPHFDLGPFYVEPGLHYSHGLGQTSTSDGSLTRWRDFIYRAAVGWEPLRGVGLFAGAGLRHPIDEPDPGLSSTYFAGISLFGGRPEPVKKNAAR